MAIQHTFNLLFRAQYLKEVDDRGQTGPEQKVAPRQPPSSYRPRSTSPHRPSHARAASTPVGYTPQNTRSPVNERTGLIRSFSTADIEGINETVDYAGTKPAGGTYSAFPGDESYLRY